MNSNQEKPQVVLAFDSNTCRLKGIFPTLYAAQKNLSTGEKRIDMGNLSKVVNCYVAPSGKRYRSAVHGYYFVRIEDHSADLTADQINSFERMAREIKEDMEKSFTELFVDKFKTIKEKM